MPVFVLLLLSTLILATPRVANSPVTPVARTIAGDNVDSLAIWLAPQKQNSLVLLTEKGSGQVMVFAADRQARFLKRFGQMKRPNGIAILQQVPFATIKSDLVFVTDRDGNAVQVYTIPDFRHVGTFGQTISQPMGISLHHARNGTVHAYVVAKKNKGNDKVTRFVITESQGRIVAQPDLSFGRELSVNQETVMVDPDHERVLVADEREGEVKVYNLQGQIQRSFGKGHFEKHVEGIVIAPCSKGGYIIVSDQKKQTEFEIFDRNTLTHLGTVTTPAAWTDGMALSTARLPDFPNGLLAVQSDPENSGGRHAEFYDLGKFLSAIGRTGCH